MLRSATIVDFNWDQYHAIGRSYGYAVADGFTSRIFVGTDYRVQPMIEEGEVKLGYMDQENVLTPFVRAHGPEIVIDVLKNHDGKYFGRWCFKKEWDTKVAELNEIKNEQKTVKKKRDLERAAELKKQAETDPSSLVQALENGWIIRQGSVNSKQVVVVRPDPERKGKMVARTFYQTRPTHHSLVRPQRQTA